jgi:hypothetical protein
MPCHPATDPSSRDQVSQRETVMDSIEMFCKHVIPELKKTPARR